MGCVQQAGQDAGPIPGRCATFNLMTFTFPKCSPNSSFISPGSHNPLHPLTGSYAPPPPPDYTRTVWTVSPEGCCLQRVLRFRVPSTTIFGAGPPTTMVTQTHRVYRETEAYVLVAMDVVLADRGTLVVDF